MRGRASACRSRLRDRGASPNLGIRACREIRMCQKTHSGFVSLRLRVCVTIDPWPWDLIQRGPVGQRPPRRAARSFDARQRPSRGCMQRFPRAIKHPYAWHVLLRPDQSRTRNRIGGARERRQEGVRRPLQDLTSNFDVVPTLARRSQAYRRDHAARALAFRAVRVARIEVIGRADSACVD